jgi:hypothetical protein
MKKKTLSEQYQHLDELLQGVNDIITPFSFRDELKAVMDPVTRKRMSERYPRCFMPVRMGNQDAFILPVCNRNGATDKAMIAFSIKLANKMLDREDVDRGMLEVTIKKLNRLHSTYSKNIPTPADRAAQKANITKSFAKMKQYLDAIHNKGIK